MTSVASGTVPEREGKAEGDRGGDPDDAGETPPSGRRLDPETVFDLLSNDRRREVVRLLDERGATELPDLATAVAVRENGVASDDLTDAQRKRVYVSLSQVHVPRMEEAGVIEDEDGTLALTDAAGRLTDHLDREHQRERDWPLAYAGVVVAGTVLVLASWGSLVPLGGTAVAALVVAAVGVLAGYHWHSVAPG